MKMLMVILAVAGFVAGCASSTQPTIAPATSSPNDAGSQSPAATQTGRPVLGPGDWKTVEGAALVAPHAVGVAAGPDGVLLLADQFGACQPPEAGGHATGLAFYDARTQQISALADSAALVGFAHTTLPDGRVLIAGGVDSQNPSGPPTTRTQLWDSRSRSWANAAPMNVARQFPTLVTMADGRALAVGGSVLADSAECEDCWTESRTAEIYDPDTDRWTMVSPVNVPMSDGAEQDDLSQLVALTGGRVLALGNNDGAALFDPSTGTWSPITWSGGWAALALPDGTALSFGIRFQGEMELPFVARFDPERGFDVVPGPAPPAGAAVAVLPDGRLFVAGGVVEDEQGYLGRYLAAASLFDPDTATWSELASMPAVRGGGSAVPLADGSVLVVGGVDVTETVRATDDEEGNDTPGCVPVEHRVIRWVP